MALAPPPLTVASNQRLRWVELFLWLAPAYCAGFTGQILFLVLHGHTWGLAGKPAWAHFPGRVGLAVSLGLILLVLLYSFWNRWWNQNFVGMHQARYHALYRWALVAGMLAGALCCPLTLWLLTAQRVPISALGVLFLGAMATLMSAATPGYYRLQGLARTQRDLLVQAQLAPHFLFNSLSTLKGQIGEDPLEAQVTADRLARLFRHLMELGSQPQIPLVQELQFVEAFLGLERARLGERLEIVIDVPEDLEAVPIPPLSLQVLVENAVRHAIAPRLEGGRLTIQARRCPGGLELRVTDPGDGTSTAQGAGRGLQVLRARLARPQDLCFSQDESGHTATLRVRTS